MMPALCNLLALGNSEFRDESSRKRDNDDVSDDSSVGLRHKAARRHGMCAEPSSVDVWTELSRYRSKIDAEALQSKNQEVTDYHIGETPRLADLAQTIREALSQLQEVNGAEAGVAAFFGATGVGKSTTINFLCGVKIVDIRETDYDDPRYEVCKSEMAHGTRYLKIGHGDSMTKTIDILPARGGILCCDMPGSSDDKEIDNIVNCVLRSQALMRSVSVRPVLILSLATFHADRYKNSKALFRYVANCFEDDSHFELVTILITHTTVDAKRTLGKLDGHFKNLIALDGLDEKAYLLIRYVHREIQNALKSLEAEQGLSGFKVRVVQPTDEANRNDILNHLENSDKITCPKTAFRFNLDEQARKAVSDSAGKELCNVISWLDEAHDFSRIPDVLIDLDEVGKALDEPHLSKRTVQQVMRSNEIRYRNVTSLVQSLITCHNGDFDVEKELRQAVDYFEKMQIIRQKARHLLPTKWLDVETLEVEYTKILMDYVTMEEGKGWDAVNGCAWRISKFSTVLNCGTAFEKASQVFSNAIRTNFEAVRLFDDPITVANALVELKNACACATEKRHEEADESLNQAIAFVIERLNDCLDKCAELSEKIESGAELEEDSNALYTNVTKLHRFTRMEPRIDGFLPEELQSNSECGFYRRFCQGLRLDKVLEKPSREMLLRHFNLLSCLIKIDDDDLKVKLRAHMTMFQDEIRALLEMDFSNLEERLRSILPEHMDVPEEDYGRTYSSLVTSVRKFNVAFSTAVQLLQVDKIYGERLCATKLTNFLESCMQRIQALEDKVGRDMSSQQNIHVGIVIHAICDDNCLNMIAPSCWHDGSMNCIVDTMRAAMSSCINTVVQKKEELCKKLEASFISNNYTFETKRALKDADEAILKLEMLRMIPTMTCECETMRDQILNSFQCFVDQNLDSFRARLSGDLSSLQLDKMIEEMLKILPSAEACDVRRLPVRPELQDELVSAMKMVELTLSDLADEQIDHQTRSLLLINLNRMIRWKIHECGTRDNGSVVALTSSRDKLVRQLGENLQKAIQALSSRKYDQAGRFGGLLLEQDRKEFVDDASTTLSAEMRKLKRRMHNVTSSTFQEVGSLSDAFEELESLLGSRLMHLLPEAVQEEIKGTAASFHEAMQKHLDKFQSELQYRLLNNTNYSAAEASLRVLVAMKSAMPNYMNKAADVFEEHLKNIQTLLDENSDDVASLQQRSVTTTELWTDLNKHRDKAPEVWNCFQEVGNSCAAVLTQKMSLIFRKLKEKARTSVFVINPDFELADRLLNTVDMIINSLRDMGMILGAPVSQSFLEQHNCQCERRIIADLKERNMSTFRAKLNRSEFREALTLFSSFVDMDKRTAREALQGTLAEIIRAVHDAMSSDHAALNRSMGRLHRFKEALEKEGREQDMLSDVNYWLQRVEDECSEKIGEVCTELKKLSEKDIVDALVPWGPVLAQAKKLLKYSIEKVVNRRNEISGYINSFCTKIDSFVKSQLEFVKNDSKGMDLNTLKLVVGNLQGQEELLIEMRTVSADCSRLHVMDISRLALECEKVLFELLVQKSKDAVQIVVDGIPIKEKLSRSLCTLNQMYKCFENSPKSQQYLEPLSNASEGIATALSEKIGLAVVAWDLRESGWPSLLNGVLLTLKHGHTVFHEAGIASLQIIAERGLKEVRDPILKEVNLIIERIDAQQGIADMCDHLLEIRALAADIDLLHDLIKDKIRKALTKAQTGGNEGHRLMMKLGDALQLSENPLGKAIIAENSHVFQRLNNIMYNKMMKERATLSIDEVVKNLSSLNPDADIEVDKLNRIYKEYKVKYDDLVKNSIKAVTRSLADRRDMLVVELRKLLKEKSKLNMVHFLATVCALYSFRKSAEHYENGADDDCIIEPHEIQVTSIIRMLGMDGAKAGLFEKLFGGLKNTISKRSGSAAVQAIQNHFMQIPTGEGKSIILGITACMFALQGCSVDCVCYSRYLSDRDFKDFEDVFAIIRDVSKDVGTVRYLTFEMLCETHIEGIREAVKSVIDGKEVGDRDDPTNTRRVLLIDEVDVFFTKRFYGNKHNPGILLQSPEISALIRHIWNCRRTWKSEEQVVQSDEYQQVVRRHGCIEPILRRSALAMVKNVKDLANPKFAWVTVNQMVGYIEGGVFTPATKKRHQNRTVFAFLSEAENGKCSEETLEQNLGIDISCGEFSYADLPNRFYTSIFGVTGTLKTLSMEEKRILQDEYSVKKETVAPSAYGVPKLDYNVRDEHHLVVAPSIGEWQLRIFNEMKAATAIGRAVLICFKNDTALREFNSARPWPDARCLNAELDDTDLGLINSYVSNATSPGRVTLLTRKFGRGLDFKASKEVVDKGGVLMIQTFFSSTESEEVQIKGRTARQGDKGSYRLILCAEHLTAKFAYKYVPGTLNEALREQLNKARQAKLVLKAESRSKLKAAAEKANSVSWDFCSALYDSTRSASQKLKILNDRNTSCDATAFVLILDVSGSMQAHWSSLRTAFDAFINALRAAGHGDETRITLIFFGSKAWTHFVDQALPRVKTLPLKMPDGGGTSFDAAFHQCHGEIKAGLQRTPHHKYTIVFMTDGEGGNPSATVSHMVKDVGASLAGYNCIAFGGGANSMNVLAVLMEIEAHFGGSGVASRRISPSDAKELVQAFADAASDVPLHMDPSPQTSHHLPPLSHV